MMSSFLVVFMPNLPIVPKGVEDLIPESDISPKEEKTLFSGLENGSPSTVSASIRKLGKRLRERVDLVVRKLRDPSPQVRAAAVEAIGFLRIRSMGNRLYRLLLHDPSPLVRGKAAEALGRLGYTKARKALRDMLDKPDIREQMGAVRALGMLGGPGTLRLLAGKLQSPSPELREAAVLALGDLGDKKALRYLVRMLGAAEPSVRAAAIRTLASLGYRRLVSKLPQYLGSHDERIVSAALDGAVTLGCRTDACAKAIGGLLGSRDPMLGADALLAGAYLNVLTQEDVNRLVTPNLPPEATRRILYGGARLGAPRILVLALRALDSPIPEVRSAALHAIRLLRPKALPRPVSAIVKEAMADTNPGVWREAFLLGIEYGAIDALPHAPKNESMDVWLRGVASMGSSAHLKAFHSEVIQAHASAFFQAASQVAPKRWQKEAVRYLMMGRDPQGVGWAALSLALTGVPAYRKLLRDQAKKRASKIPELLVACAVAESFSKGDQFYRFLDHLTHSSDRRVAMFAAAAMWRAAPVSGEGPFTKAFDSYFMKGLNNLQKVNDFNYLSNAFTSSFSPWATRAASSRVYLVVWRSMVWKREYRNIQATPLKEPSQVTQVPVQEPKKPRLNLPFKVQQQPKEGCSCHTTGGHQDPALPVSLLALAYLLRRRRNGLDSQEKTSS